MNGRIDKRLNVETLQLGYISIHGSGNMRISEGTIYTEMCMRRLHSSHLVYCETGIYIVIF